MRSLLLILLFTGAAPLFAESRTWKSADGVNSFSGEYVSHDDKQVTIRREDGKVFTVDYAKLHTDDKTWVTAQPVGAEPPKEVAKP